MQNDWDDGGFHHLVAQVPLFLASMLADKSGTHTTNLFQRLHHPQS